MKSNILQPFVLEYHVSNIPIHILQWYNSKYNLYGMNAPLKFATGHNVIRIQ